MAQDSSPAVTPPSGLSSRHLTKDGASVDRTLTHLRGRILRGELLPGEQLRQQELAAEVGVSRIPLREALRALAAQGLLEHRPHQGYFVAKWTRAELVQLHLMQGLLERELMRTIVWPDQALLDELRRMNENMRAVADQWDWYPLLAINRAFHFKIFALSPLGVVLKEVEHLWWQAEVYQALSLGVPEIRRRTLDEHDAIIAALAARDQAACLGTFEVHRAHTHEGVAHRLRE